jgi:glycosyltransferase involved in cell wall biosynthesis
LWEQVALPVALARAGADLHHGMGFSLPLGDFRPAVVTIYDLSFLRFPDRFKSANRLYLTAITRLAARRARRVIAISESTRAEVEALLGVPAERIDVAMPGVGHHFRPLSPKQVEAFRHRNGLPERFILYLGTLEPRKNLETLLHAFAALPQKDVPLVLVGGRGWLYHAIEDTIEELNLRPRVTMPGYVADEMLPLWYNAATVFAYPSLYEGFGLPLLEAMACGTPVVAADTTSLPEVVGREGAGILLPPDDRDAWCHALGTLLDDDEHRRELFIRGRKRAADFSWHRTALQTVASYHRALNDE